MRRAGIRVLLAAAFLGGCGSSSDGENGAADGAASDRSAQDGLSIREVLVETVHSIEIGRTRDGFTVTAFGTAPALGYANPRLRIRRDGRTGADGFLDFDFVATPPEPGLERGQGAAAVRRIRADAHLTTKDLFSEVVTGIRVHGVSGGVQFLF